ncbi:MULTISPECIES: hypothetical protein [unclassified Streptomyces]|uniref:hypothetical protein n=1 Tax=unclassified Streptomyces TaxID=2593676 RepID=UPI0008DE5D40|nr:MULTISPECIES: hypothetical protein [unclassified Streptomyces]OII64903.1 hypothetical protein BJP39_09450 [Streptomyces sp. CC77]
MGLISVLFPFLLPPAMLGAVMAMARYEDLVLPYPEQPRDPEDPLIDPAAPDDATPPVPLPLGEATTRRGPRGRADAA